MLHWLPFTATEVTVLLETLMQTLIKQSEMQAANSAVEIAKLNVMETSIHLAPSDVEVFGLHNVGSSSYPELGKSPKRRN